MIFRHSKVTESVKKNNEIHETEMETDTEKETENNILTDISSRTKNLVIDGK